MLNRLIVNIFVRVALLSAVALLAMFDGIAGLAQSSLLDRPTPVRSNQISGTIEPRDLGDPRLTQHFWVFSGTQGDLVVNAETANLNGDIDVFVAGSMRPLTKISLFAGTGSSTAAKTIFLREPTSLILRVEARSADDNAGTYRISFSGAFEPSMQTFAEDTENLDVAPKATAGRRGNRVNSVGARIIEPPEPEPPAAEAAKAPEKEDTKVAEAPPVSNETNEAAPAPKRNPTSRRNTAKSTSRRSASSGRRNTTPPKPTAKAPEETGPSVGTKTAPPKPPNPMASVRLIIQLKDGNSFERTMDTVKRVTVANGVILVTEANGHVERIPITNVTKMAIEPQVPESQPQN
jgi:hypothetical protein